MKGRIRWIDGAKGFGMLLVMLAHAKIPVELKKIIYTFHVPLFFFLSGYVFNVLKYNNFNTFIKRKILSLIIPYLSFSFINYIYWICIYRNFINNTAKSRSINILKPLVGTFYAQRGTEWTLHNGTMWFVACLFFSELLLYFIIKKANNNNKKIIIYLFACSIIGYLYSKYVGYELPWSIDASITAVVFLGVGYTLKDWINIKNTNFKYLLILILVNIISGFYNKKIDMFSNAYGNYILFYLSAFSGIFAIIIFIRLLERVKPLTYIGKNSLIFLAFHQFILFPLIDKMSKYLHLYDIQGKLRTLLYGIGYTIMACVVLVPIAYFINKYIPFILGSQNKNKNNKVTISS